ncbi:MAG: hypothetical protein V7723_12225 [Sneathiella sp.]|uniref:hypothetical protein n=1 Tax=Sneathiella sp. TaxID=1964365 RepID=UPI00300172AF
MYIPGEALLPHKQYHLEQALKIRALFEKVTAGEGISAEWRQEESELPNISQNVIKSAHAADLVILGQANEDKDDANIREVAGDVLMECGRPVLLVPYSGTFAEIGYHILVGWNGSWESARAVFDALPFLKSVNQVHLHWAALVQPDSEEKIILGADLAATLADMM